MNIRSRHGIVGGLMASVALSMVAAALCSEREGPISGQSPQTAPAFKPGDIIAVVPERASLMRGGEVVAVVPGGQRIVVVEVRNHWIGTYVFANGERKAGWLRTADFIPINDSAKPQEGQVCLCAVQTATAAPPNPGAACRARSEPTRDYFRDYYTGYYERHETDPNIHAWEPWRH